MSKEDIVLLVATTNLKLMKSSVWITTTKQEQYDHYYANHATLQ